MTTKYTVMADVTPEQYEALVANSVSCRMVIEDDDVRIWDENNIPEFVQAALLEVLDEDEDDEWSVVEDMDVTPYVPAVRHWPADVRFQVLELSSYFIAEHVETGAGNEVYSSLEPSGEEAKALLDAFPQLREMFSASPDEVAAWFR